MTTNEHIFHVAGLAFAVILPAGWDADILLPSFRPFRCSGCLPEQPVFRLTALEQEFTPDCDTALPLATSTNDMGTIRLLRTSLGYRMDITQSHYADVPRHTLIVNGAFSLAIACLNPSDPYFGNALSSMLRILFAQAVLLHEGISIHASCVCLHGHSYLFLGKSGTGKSTHARQWLQAFPGCTLLNDDNPVLRLVDGTPMAYGTPWSGKTPCYHNLSAPVAGIARLRQSPHNRFHALQATEAFAAMLPSCSAIRHDRHLQESLHTTIIHLVGHTKIGIMECLPIPEAATICHHALSHPNIL